MKMTEERILIESKNHFFSFEFIDDNLYYSCYDKNRKKYLLENCKIKRKENIQKFHNFLKDRKSGAIFKESDINFMVRNHDINKWIVDTTTEEIHVDECKSSRNDLYDTRNKSRPTRLGKYILSIKRMWVNGRI